MSFIRNRFVHHNGRTNQKTTELQNKYDFYINSRHIILNENFNLNYIKHLEKFCIELATLLYGCEFLQDNLELKKSIAEVTEVLDEYVKLKRKSELIIKSKEEKIE